MVRAGHTPPARCTLRGPGIGSARGDTDALGSKVPGGKGPEGTVWKGDPMEQLGFMARHLDGNHDSV